VDIPIPLFSFQSIHIIRSFFSPLIFFIMIYFSL